MAEGAGAAGAIGELEKQVSMRRGRRRFCVSCVIVLCEQEAKDLWKNNKCDSWVRLRRFLVRLSLVAWVCADIQRNGRRLCKNDAEIELCVLERATSRITRLGG
ncbi:hypothetical protein R6Q59_003859 [Mikania micrantha]